MDPDARADLTALLACADHEVAPLLERPPAGRCERIDVLLYLIDTLRADRLSVYGYERPTSPQLEKLASQGTLFLRAYAPGSKTVPTVTALFASRYPSELRGRLRADGPGRHTLAEVFQAAGYSTAAFQANVALRPGFGYGRGFDTYRRVVGERHPERPKVDAEDLHAQALEWLRSQERRPFFLYIQTMDTHTPYDPPAPFADSFTDPNNPTPATLDELRALSHPTAQQQAMLEMREGMTPEQQEKLDRLFRSVNPDHLFGSDHYDGAVAYADHELGRLVKHLRELGLWECMALVITSDHGELLGEHGQFLHARFLYEELVHVPLLVILPGAAGGGRRVEEIVSLMDVAPTLANLAGLEVPDTFLGRSWLRPRPASQPPRAVGELIAPRTRTSLATYVREGPWKLVAGKAGVQLFHLPTDPDEKQDVSAAHPSVTEYLSGVAADAVPAPSAEAEALGPPGSELPEAEQRELQEDLRALGYVE